MPGRTLAKRRASGYTLFVIFPEASILLVVLLALGTLCLAFWIWMLVECVTKEPDTGNTKVAWLLIILFAHIVGALIYYLVRREQRWREVGR